MKYKSYPIFIVVLLSLFIVSCEIQTQEQPDALSWDEGRPYHPDLDLGELFEDVQTSDLFPDSKTFVDYRPKFSPKKILKDYQDQKESKDFDLKQFVESNFDPPLEVEQKPLSDFPEEMSDHLNQHWDYLTRSPDEERGITSLIPLPNSYVVPGGRFREVYYWDSYFTMLGLAESGKVDLIEGMVKNFDYLIDTIGFIPNGNRSYYMGRSQPPFYASMIDLYGEVAGEDNALQFLESLEREYNFWMKGSNSFDQENDAILRVVRMPDGEVLNRYYDNFERPRPEAYKEDVELAEGLSEEGQKTVYRNLRAAAESGWDFSTRWFEDGKSFSTIVTTNIIPVDLNSLLYNVEKTLAGMYILAGDLNKAEDYSKKAEVRKKAINEYLWDEESGIYRDLNFIRNEFTPVKSLATAYPLFFEVADQDQAEKVAMVLESDFLFEGGFVSTLNDSGQQWDYPNGWAPLQWLCVQGLMNYDLDELAETGAERWLILNERVYQEEKKMMEKYNVTESGLSGGGGEYPNQDGFGWTNGVALKMISVFELEPVESM